MSFLRIFLAAALLGTSVGPAAAGTSTPAQTPAPTPARPPVQRTLGIAVAASVKPAAEQLARAFEAAHPGVTVRLTSGASGAFAAQIQSGAPFDLFLSADRKYPERLMAVGLTAGGETVYAVGELVAWLPAGSKLDLDHHGLAALVDPSVRRIAIANPATAPFGRLAERVLQAAGVLDAVRGRLVLGASVAQAAQHASTGAADVALLPRSLTVTPPLSAGRVVRLPGSLSPRLEQSAVVLARAHDPELARAFLAFLVSEPGRFILARAGYGLP